MMRAVRTTAVVLAALALQACLAKTAIDTAVGVATLPVKVASKGIDLATTSQSEADQKRGQEMRERVERLGKLQRDYERQMERCQDGRNDACDDARETYAEMQVLMPGIPVEGS